MWCSNIAYFACHLAIHPLWSRRLTGPHFSSLFYLVSEICSTTFVNTCLPKFRSGPHNSTIWHTITVQPGAIMSGKLAGIRPELILKPAFSTSVLNSSSVSLQQGTIEIDRSLLYFTFEHLINNGFCCCMVYCCLTVLGKWWNCLFCVHVSPSVILYSMTWFLHLCLSLLIGLRPQVTCLHWAVSLVLPPSPFFNSIWNLLSTFFIHISLPGFV